jgi:hypothetical protein
VKDGWWLVIVVVMILAWDNRPSLGWAAAQHFHPTITRCAR